MKKEFNKENIFALIEQIRWQAEFLRECAKTKKAQECYNGQITACDILKSNITAIWPNK